MKLNQAAVGSWGLVDWEFMATGSGNIPIKHLLERYGTGSWIHNATVVIGIIVIVAVPMSRHAEIEGIMKTQLAEQSKQIAELAKENKEQSRILVRQSNENAKMLSNISGALTTSISELRLEMTVLRSDFNLGRVQMLAKLDTQKSKIEVHRLAIAKHQTSIGFLQRTGDTLKTFHLGVN